MAGTPIDPRSLEWVAQQARERLEAQKWWQTKSNTTTVLIGTVATVLAFLAGQATGTTYGEWIGAAAGWVGTIYAVFKTPNGMTKREVERLEYAAGRAGHPLPTDGGA